MPDQTTSEKLLPVRTASRLVRRGLEQAPDFSIYRSISAQLDYLEALLTGAKVDRRRLGEIILGLYAVREFEASDPELAEQLFACQRVADELAQGRPS